MQKFDKVKKVLEENGIESFLFTYFPNVFYISNFSSSNAYILFDKGEFFFLTDKRYLDNAISKLSVPVIEIKNGLFNTVNTLFQQRNIKTLLTEDSISFSFFESFKDIIKPVKNPLKHIRAIKDKDELDLMKKAANITDITYKKIIENIESFDTEQSVRTFIVCEALRQNAKGESFSAIVASRESSSIPHWETSTKKIEKGALLIDMGVIYEGYCSDFTRTLHIGRASDEFKKVYNIVKDAHFKALEKAKVGNTLKDVDLAARTYIEEKGFGEFFTHSVGHGIGIEIHEYPRVYFDSPDKDVVIEENMVFTIEPGIYLPNYFGVRLENIIVASNEPKPLSEIPLDLIEL